MARRPESSSRPTVAAGLVALFVLAILLVTLAPAYSRQTPISPFCLICGSRGAADAIANWALFVPLGAALAFARISTVRILVYAAALSSGIELAQALLPGRHPAIGDVVFNLVGAISGAVLLHSASHGVKPSPKLARQLWMLGLAVAILVPAATAHLVRPSLPASTYWGQWTPRLGHLEPYDGRVVAAYLGDLELPSWRLEDSAAARRALLSGESLRATALAGSEVPGLASIVSIADVHGREIALLGPDRGALVFRYRMRAASLRLDQPDLRLLGAFHSVEPGDTLHLEAWRQAGTGCLILNEERACGLGFSVGSGWSFLLYAGSAPGWLKAGLNMAWLALMFAPLGFWSRSPRRLLLAAALAGTVLAGLPLITDLLATAPAEYAGAFFGLLGSAWSGTRFQG